MRIHPLCLLFLALPFAAATQTSCIIGCKCEEEVRTLKVRECESPLLLTKESLGHVSKKIATLGIKNSVIQHIEADAFTGFNDLETVVIEDSTIDSIDPSALLHLPELGTLRFTRTTFGQSPNLSSDYLEELIFDDCKLTQIPILDQLPALSFLNLADNQIGNIDEAAFSKLENLEEVRMSNNSISKLPAKLFFNNSDFTVLNLDHNPLSTFDLQLDSLEILSLRHCKFTKFDRQTTEKLKLLNTLHLSDNEISVLPIDVFEPMTDLNYLDLSNNKLVELDDDIFFQNEKLDKIVLDNNPFQKLPHFQSKSKNFQTFTFSCKNCGLKSVKGSFDNMKYLVTLDLSNNQLEDIDGVFTRMPGLTEINLSNNNIRSIGINAFEADSKLQNLDLSHNPLLPLDPVVLASLQSLKKLNVSSCNLQKLWANHNSELPSLEQLFIDNNQLAVIRVDDLKIIPKLKSIDLHANPLACTEDLNDFVKYFVEKSIHPTQPTAQELMPGKDITYNPKNDWQSVFPDNCDIEYPEDDEVDDKDDEDDDDDKIDYDEDDIDYDEDDDLVQSEVLDKSGFNLAKASYILSITSVFILTALLVLFVAVVITLLILKRNKAFNMHNGNLPRLKIPLWHSQPAQKKHSGSIYKPLSEDLSGSRIMSWYDFKQTPQVHNSLP